eukprot:350288-Prorocentrum_minimum.AAC.7
MADAGVLAQCLSKPSQATSTVHTGKGGGAEQTHLEGCCPLSGEGCLESGEKHQRRNGGCSESGKKHEQQDGGSSESGGKFQRWDVCCSESGVKHQQRDGGGSESGEKFQRRDGGCSESGVKHQQQDGGCSESGVQHHLESGNGCPEFERACLLPEPTTEYDWTADDLQQLQRVEYLIAADCIYDDHLTDAFFATVTHLLTAIPSLSSAYRHCLQHVFLLELDTEIRQGLIKQPRYWRVQFYLADIVRVSSLTLRWFLPEPYPRTLKP